MRKTYLTPGVYLQEQSFQPPAIEHAPTSTAAIIGSFPRGVMMAPKQVRTWAAFEKEYGGLSNSTLSSHCIKQFFDNEGKALWVIRIGTGQMRGASPFLEGLSLLDRVGGFNILCIPQAEQLSDAQAARVMQAAITLVIQHRAIYLLDVPRRDASRQTVITQATWVNRQPGIHHPNVALYVPRVQVPQSSGRSPLQTIPASGTMAGVLARTDLNRGVWKAPAGTEGILQGVQGLEQTLTQQDMGQLTSMGINPIRQATPSRYVAVCRVGCTDPVPE